jgi:hypothetical protein
LSAIENREGVLPIEHMEPQLGYTRVVLEVGGGVARMRQTCEAIASMVHRAGGTLAELAPERLNLEGVFLNLLRKREAKPEPEPAAVGAANEPAAAANSDAGASSDAAASGDDGGNGGGGD